MYMQRYDSTIPALTFRIFLFWGGSWEGTSKPLNFSAGNPSSLHPCYVKNPAWAPATTLRWFQPKRRLKDKKVVMQTCPWSEICWMWGAMVKHMCNHLQSVYIYANYDILTSVIFIIWHANCFLLRFLMLFPTKNVNVQAQLLTSVAGWVDIRETWSLSNQSLNRPPPSWISQKNQSILRSVNQSILR